MPCVFISENGEGDLNTQTHVKVGAETGVVWPQAKDTGNHQKPKEARMDSPLEPLGGTWSC